MFHLRIKLLDDYNVDTGGFDYKHLHPVLWDALSMYNKSKERFDSMSRNEFFKLHKEYKSKIKISLIRDDKLSTILETK